MTSACESRRGRPTVRVCRRVAVLAAALSTAWLAPAAAAPLVPDMSYLREPNPRQMRFDGYRLATTAGGELAFVLFDPKPEPGTKLPLVIALHDGRAGVNGAQHAESRAFWLVPTPSEQRAGAAFTAFVAAPQAADGWGLPATAGTTGADDAPSGAKEAEVAPGPMDAAVLELIDKLAATRAIDPKRVHLYGFGTGADAAFRLAAARPDRFASVFAAWPAVPSQDVARRLASLPILVFMRDRAADMAAPLVVQALRDAGNTQVEFISAPRANLNDFREANILGWLDRQQRP